MRKREELLNVEQESNVKLFNLLASVSPPVKDGHFTASRVTEIEDIKGLAPG